MTNSTPVYPEFNVGDEVICIGNPDTRNGYDREPFGGGYGWQLGLKFKVTRITRASLANTQNKGDCYWGGLGGKGVFAKFLRLAKEVPIQNTVDPDELLGRINALKRALKR